MKRMRIPTPNTMPMMVEIDNDLVQMIADRLDATGGFPGSLINQAIRAYLTEPGSVLNPWVRTLTFMQQSVLLAMVRNADGINKHHPQKQLIKWFRRCVLQSAFDRRHLEMPGLPGGGSFTGPVHDIEAALDEFIWARDEMTLHYFAHAMHAFEILGYKYPEPAYRDFWHRAYMRCVDAMHMMPETEEMLDQRLCDNEKFWIAREDKCGGCTRTERKDEPKEHLILSGEPLPYDHGQSGIAGDMGVSCPGAVGVPSDGAIYAAVSRKIDEATTGLKNIPEIESLGDLIPKDHQPQMSLDGMPIEPVPQWAGVRESDGRFVNLRSGLDAGYEFQQIWEARKSEFPIYDETQDITQPGPKSEPEPFYDQPTDKEMGAFKGLV